MAIRVRYDIKVTLSESTSESNELGKTTPWIGVNDQQEDGGTWSQTIPGLTTDLLVDINGLADATFLGIKTDREIILKKNAAGGEPWTITPLGIGAEDGVFIVSTTGVTSLYISNAGAADAKVTFQVAGTN